MRELRWYGWGYADKTYSLDHRPHAWKFLRRVLDLRGDEVFSACDFDSIQLRAPRIDAAALRMLADVQTDKRTRVLHAFGKSYRDLVRLRRGEITNPPDAIVYPANEEQVTRVIQFCAENNFALVPFGGGSSVVGGVEPRCDASHLHRTQDDGASIMRPLRRAKDAPSRSPVGVQVSRGTSGSNSNKIFPRDAASDRVTITLDLARMNRVLALDEISQTATIEAGIFGPDLERALNARGFTLGHFPQSFEFSTLGGWIATRGAGLASTKYGKIEAMTASVRVATPSGIVETHAGPASAAGPALLQLLIGSEGTLGVITRATMRVRELPKTRDYRALLFKSCSDGVAAIRAMLQSGVVPATVRLSDEDETRTLRVFALREDSRGWKGFAERVGLCVLNARGYSFERGALMILGFEGDPSTTLRMEQAHGLVICESHGAVDLGHGVARAWLRDRYETPYLRDVLMDHGILVDTLETATTWENLERLHVKLADAIANATEATGSRALVMTHVSHCYRDGASLYVTFLARMVRGQEIGQWETIKRAATECIVANGGTLSHHHGVGYEHGPWLDREVGALGMAALCAVKNVLDPNDVMNPGKLINWSTRD